MSIDVLQNKIRKLKNPSAVVFTPDPELIPGGQSVRDYFGALLEALRDHVAAARFDVAEYALYPGGLEDLSALTVTAKAMGYYVILDWTALESVGRAKRSAEAILKEQRWSCDAMVISCYGGTDILKPWFKAAGKDRDLFPVIKTANKSGTELQDLQTGGRFVYTAAADLISRLGETAMERCGYSRLGVTAGCYNAASLRTLRQNYPKLFLLVDGLDQTGCNAKNASYAFDQLGHGALVCAGESILGAWKEGEERPDPVTAALEAAERMRKNLNRYVTIL
ncbi:MAG: hypothetical protein IJ960_09535 [Oscillospiraceae bacterium]|nr:hypothetical protein [Oscillospiraceae bacterium]